MMATLAAATATWRLRFISKVCNGPCLECWRICMLKRNIDGIASASRCVWRFIMQNRPRVAFGWSHGITSSHYAIFAGIISTSKYLTSHLIIVHSPIGTLSYSEAERDSVTVWANFFEQNRRTFASWHSLNLPNKSSIIPKTWYDQTGLGNTYPMYMTHIFLCWFVEYWCLYHIPYQKEAV